MGKWENSEYKKLYFKQYYQTNKKDIIKRSKKWKQENTTKARESSKQWNRENKDKIKAINTRLEKRSVTLKNTVKGHYGCMNPNCTASNLEPCCLDFHHIDKKSFSLGCNHHRNIKALSQEINKCILLCANCHRLVTHKNLDVSKINKCKLNNEGTPI